MSGVLVCGLCCGSLTFKHESWKIETCWFSVRILMIGHMWYNTCHMPCLTNCIFINQSKLQIFCLLLWKILIWYTHYICTYPVLLWVNRTIHIISSKEAFLASKEGYMCFSSFKWFLLEDEVFQKFWDFSLYVYILRSYIWIICVEQLRSILESFIGLSCLERNAYAGETCM